MVVVVEQSRRGRSAHGSVEYGERCWTAAATAAASCSCTAGWGWVYRLSEVLEVLEFWCRMRSVRVGSLGYCEKWVSM